MRCYVHAVGRADARAIYVCPTCVPTAGENFFLKFPSPARSSNTVILDTLVPPSMDGDMELVAEEARKYEGAVGKGIPDEVVAELIEFGGNAMPDDYYKDPKNRHAEFWYERLEKDGWQEKIGAVADLWVQVSAWSQASFDPISKSGDIRVMKTFSGPLHKWAVLRSRRIDNWFERFASADSSNARTNSGSVFLEGLAWTGSHRRWCVSHWKTSAQTTASSLNYSLERMFA